MAKLTELSNCRFRSRDRQSPRGPDGMVLVIVMVVATLLLIALTAALPSILQEGQREREAELIFRGTQYGRAVALFHRRFNRYPVSVKELLGTNGQRFLRQEYRDPMDPKGKWRFIHVSAAGALLDSKNRPLNNNQNNPAGIGGNNSSSSNSIMGGNSSMGGANSSAFQGGGNIIGANSPAGGSGQIGPTSSFGGANSSAFQGGGNIIGGNSPAGGSGQIGPTSSFFGNQNETLGAYIAGVAATSHHESIKVWQKHRHYDEWEFLGIDMGIFGIQVGMPGSSGPTGMGQQPTTQGPGFTNGPPGITPPPQTFGPSPN